MPECRSRNQAHHHIVHDSSPKSVLVGSLLADASVHELLEHKARDVDETAGPESCEYGVDTSRVRDSHGLAYNEHTRSRRECQRADG